MKILQRRRMGWCAGLLLLLFISSMSAVADEWVYTVRPGDNLWDLTQRYLVSVRYWRPLQRLNRIDDPRHMPPGSKLRMPKPWSRIRQVGARVVAVEGRVQIIGDGDQISREAREGDLLKQGDRLSTEPESSLLLEFTDGTRLLLTAGSDLKLDRLEGYGDGEAGQTRLNMPRGGSETQANPKKIPGSRFEISAPSALTAVRGTHFRLAADDGGKRSRVEVIEGRVQVANERREVSVNSGFGVIAETGRSSMRPKKLLPAPEGLLIPEKIEEVSFGFEAAPSSGSFSHRVQISESQGLTTPVYERLFSPGRILVDVADLPDRRYILKVRAVDSEGLEGKDALYAFELNTRPPAPIQLTPREESQSVDSSPGFSWARPEGGAGYRFELAFDRSMNQLLVELNQLQEEGLTLDEPLQPGRYFWRVTALDSQGKPGPEGVPREFRILPKAPDSAPPLLDETGITFHWRPGVEGQQHRFQLASDVEFNNLIEDVRTSEARYRLESPAPGTTYYMRVKTIDVDGSEGPFGRVQTLVVPGPDYGWVVLLPVVFGFLLAL